MGEAMLTLGLRAVESAGAGCSAVLTRVVLTGAVFTWASKRGWGRTVRIGGTRWGVAARSAGCAAAAGAAANLSPRRINGCIQMKAIAKPPKILCATLVRSDTTFTPESRRIRASSDNPDTSLSCTANYCASDS
jgi:hypothetical protein